MTDVPCPNQRPQRLGVMNSTRLGEHFFEGDLTALSLRMAKHPSARSDRATASQIERLPRSSPNADAFKESSPRSRHTRALRTPATSTRGCDRCSRRLDESTRFA
jgi:hypothetical protein